MGSVGIRELKAHLSRYVERVRGGEPVVITDHGEEVAVMIPVSAERRAARAMVAAGLAQWAGGKPAGLKGLTLRGKPLSMTVLAERT